MAWSNVYNPWPVSGMDNPTMGGSEEELQRNRAQYDQGIIGGQTQNAAGQQVAMGGIPLAQQAGQAGAGVSQAGMGLYGSGIGMGADAMRMQNAAIGGSVAGATRDIGSVAQQQQIAATEANNRQMMAMAAQARGGNQAAAMRNAQAQGSANIMQRNQQLAMMRMAEEAAKRDAYVQAQQFAASQYGNQAQLGYGTAVQGLGAANAGAGTMNDAGQVYGGIGSSIMNSGTQNTGNFLNAELANNQAQMASDMKLYEEQKKLADVFKQGMSMVATQGAMAPQTGGGRK